MKQRIWELDALRGLCVLGMVAVHLLFDLVDVYALVQWQYPPFVTFLFRWGGIAFILISGICVTLGSHCVRRGLIVFGCGMLCTLVTWLCARIGFIDDWIVIWFGVLHCLGCCMLLWWVFQRLNTPLLAICSVVLIGLGFWFSTLTVETPFLAPLGLQYPGFTSGDYFPILPNLGFFLLGSLLGRLLYKEKATLFPKVNPRQPLLRFLQFCGKQSLWIYLLHQPILSGIFMILSSL